MASAIAPDIMPFTNYTYDFKGMIDYIFYPKNLMQPFGLLGPVDEEWLKENKIMGCPQPHITSGKVFTFIRLINLTITDKSMANLFRIIA